MAGDFKDHFTFVLTEPETAANIGAAARALNTMGFQRLAIINPHCDHLSHEARYVAHASEHFLTSATIYSSFAEMAKSYDVVIGTTADHRTVKTSYIDSDEIRSVCQTQGIDENIALVFGRERVGLENNEIEICDFVSSLPMAQKHPTLNLGQSVMLFAYIISHQNKIERAHRRDRVSAGSKEYSVLKNRVSDILEDLKFGMRARGEVLSRLPLLKGRDVKLVHHLVSRLQTCVTQRKPLSEIKNKAENISNMR